MIEQLFTNSINYVDTVIIIIIIFVLLSIF